MGVQTFDPALLARMGRSAFGDEASIEKLIGTAREAGFTVSGDFLFNLPGQKREAMLRDVARARTIGLDQACFYHLVLY
jgi:coproporphyrinogen III oxidase-like Fe-S oxidoreductase